MSLRFPAKKKLAKKGQLPQDPGVAFYIIKTTLENIGNMLVLVMKHTHTFLHDGYRKPLQQKSVDFPIFRQDLAIDQLTYFQSCTKQRKCRNLIQEAHTPPGKYMASHSHWSWFIMAPKTKSPPLGSCGNPPSIRNHYSV